MTLSTSAFRKSAAGSPSEVFVWEAVGLSWLRVPGGAPVVDVLEVGADHLDLVRLHEVAPTAEAAEELGRGLAVVHDAGAAAYGVAPDGWEGDGFWGPLGRRSSCRPAPGTPGAASTPTPGSSRRSGPAATAASTTPATPPPSSG